MAVALVTLAANCASVGEPGSRIPSVELAAGGSSPSGARLLEPVPGPADRHGANGPLLDGAESAPTLLPAAGAALVGNTSAAAQSAATSAAPSTAADATASPAATPTVPVTVEGPAPAPEGGHPPHPEAGMVPREHPYWDYPNCAPGPPWASDCYPPSEWEISQDLADCRAGAYPDLGVGGICAGRRANEKPRWTSDVARWTSWCFRQPRGNCTWLLHQMKWALDFLGAHPWCVLNEYQDRADAYGAGGTGNTVKNRHGWHNCATVIDPLAERTYPGRSNDSGLLLSGTVTLAEQCRMVLPADVRLETRVHRSSEQPERFGSDCDQWAEWVLDHPRGWDNADCWRSARLAEEWMEHRHATPERYFTAGC